MEYGTLISVVMPVYNRAHLMPHVLGSLVAQTYRNLEIIVADDCSDDDIEGAVAAFDDPRIKLVRRDKNGGAASARNTGLAAASGKLVAFHDSDDICLVDRLEKSVRLLTNLPEDYIGVYGVCLFYTQITSSDMYRKMNTYTRPFRDVTPIEGDLAERTVRDNIINLPTVLVKASALEAAGPSDTLLRKNVDWDLMLRLTRQGKFGFIPEPLILSPISMDPAVSAKRVSRSERQGARSFARISGKLRREGLGGKTLARHYSSTAKYLMRIDRPKFARRFLKAAIVLTPSDPKLWAHLALSHMPGIHAKFRKPADL